MKAPTGSVILNGTVRISGNQYRNFMKLNKFDLIVYALLASFSSSRNRAMYVSNNFPLPASHH